MVFKTLNPVIGCLHLCSYCWARMQAKRQKHRCMKCYRFEPHTHFERLKGLGGRTKFVWFVDMGDLFGPWVPREWIERILDVIREHPGNRYMFLTKNPARYREFSFNDNTILGATIETNRFYNVSKAPPPVERVEAMSTLDHGRFVVIEPILDFDLEEMTEMMRKINPEHVYVGYDNYNLFIPEARNRIMWRRSGRVCEET